jgi:hypothetical protein
MEAAMASSFSAFFGGVATVAVALGIGFGGGLYLTDTSLMSEPVGGKTAKQDQPKSAPASQPVQATPAEPATAVEKSPPQSTAAAPRTATQPAVEPDRIPTSGPPFARVPDDARASATSDDEDSAKAQRRKAIAAQKAVKQQHRAERRRLERAERLAADNEMKAAVAARDRARLRYDQDDDDEPRGFLGFASGRDPDRKPTFFGIPLFGD